MTPSSSNEGVYSPSIMALPLSCTYGAFTAPPSTASRNCCGSIPSPRASAIDCAMPLIMTPIQALMASLSLLASPTVSLTHWVREPIASKTGATVSRSDDGPEASTTS